MDFIQKKKNIGTKNKYMVIYREQKNYLKLKLFKTKIIYIDIISQLNYL